jgi:hypothetical protein
MFLPVNVDVPMTRLPVVNWAIIAIIACTSIVGWNDQRFFDCDGRFQSTRNTGMEGTPRSHALRADVVASVRTVIARSNDWEHTKPRSR